MRLNATRANVISSARGLGNQLWDLAGSRPSLDLRFADSKSLTDAVSGQNLITYTRASGATFTDSQGVIRNAVTNLLLRSEEFGDAYWTKFATTVSINTSSSPTGSATADSIVESATTAQHGLQAVSAFTPITTTAYTGSVYAKASERTLINVYWSNGFNGLEIGAYFNLSSGLAYSASAGVTASIASSGNGWYRCSISAVSGASPGLTNFGVRLVSSGTTLSYTGDGTSGIFLWGAQLEQSATVGEYIPTATTINSAPRFDHNPTTGESLGLLIEEQRTNIALNSADVSQWQILNSSVVATNQVTAPDGSLSGDGVTAGATNSNVTQQATITSSTNAYAVSYFVKNNNSANSRIDAYIRAGSTINVSGSIAIDWNALTATGSGAAANVRFTPYINGWYRVSFSLTDNNAASDNLRSQFFPDITTGNKQVYLWGLQLEIGAFATSYIPTTGTAATRSADVASITSSAFSGFYRQDQGTFYAEASKQSASNGAILEGSDGSTFSGFTLSTATWIADVGTRLDWINRTATLADGAPFFAGTVSATALGRIAATLTATQTVLARNGAIATGPGGSTQRMPVNSMFIGARIGATFVHNGHIRRLVYFPQRLSNEVLQRITL